MSATITWEGQTLRTLTLDYATAVGISPQAAHLTCAAGDYPPAIAGTLAFGFGPDNIVLPDCALAADGFSESRSEAGAVWSLAIEDRRWRWRDGYPVFGEYNQTDRRGKLIPRTVRSPFQIAATLLLAMGESDFSVTLPAGLAGAGAGVPAKQTADVLIDPKAEYLNLGQNLPPTGANPRVSWACVPAAKALASFAEQFGCVVVLNPITNQVSVEPLGSGTPLPIVPGILSQTPGVSVTPVPASLTVYGRPTRFQARLVFRPVARDWDDSWQPLDNVSYAPDAPADQAMTVYARGAGLASAGIRVLGRLFTAADIPSLAAAITASTLSPAAVLAQSLTGPAPGNEPVLELAGGATGLDFQPALNGAGELVCTAGPRKASDRFALQSDFMAGVKPTTRLSYPQARQLAQSSVWRCYQLVAADPADPGGLRPTPPPPGVPVPGLGTTADPLGVGPNPGRVTDRTRIVLQATRVEQVAPRPGDEDRIDTATGQPYAAETYDGYSRDRAPATYGGIWRAIQTGGNYVKNQKIEMGNTPPGDQFYVPFDIIDPERQVIRFARPVYRVLGGGGDKPAWADGTPLPDAAATGQAVYCAPQLVVETAFTLLDDPGRCERRFSDTLVLGGPGPAVAEVRDDIQQEVIGVYDAQHNVISGSAVDADAFARAVLYLNARAATYQVPQSLAVTFAGVRLVPLSGQIRQVAWSLSERGFTTSASQNSEFSSAVLPLPARRRAERLSPNMMRALENLASDPVARARRNVLDLAGGLARLIGGA